MPQKWATKQHVDLHVVSEAQDDPKYLGYLTRKFEFDAMSSVFRATLEADFNSYEVLPNIPSYFYPGILASWYGSRWARFLRWCNEKGVPLPAPMVKMAYYSEIGIRVGYKRLDEEVLEKIHWMAEYILYALRRDPEFILMSAETWYDTRLDMLQDGDPTILNWCQLEKTGAQPNTYRGMEIRLIPWLKRGEVLVC
jgi:hypothetical protein